MGIKNKSQSNNISRPQRASATTKKKFTIILNMLHIGLMGSICLILTLSLTLIYGLIVRPKEWVEAPLFTILMIAIGCLIKIAYLEILPKFKAQSWSRPIIIMALAISPLALSPHLLGPLIDTTMSAMGVRMLNVGAAISLDEYALARTLSQRLGKDLGECENSVADKCILMADILFQNIGEKALIRPHLPMKENGTQEALHHVDKELRITVNSKTMQTGFLK